MDNITLARRFALADQLSALLKTRGCGVVSESVADDEVALQMASTASQREGVVILKAAGHKAKARRWPGGEPEIVVKAR